MFFYKKIFLTIEMFVIFYFKNGSIFFMINIYSDSNQSALKYLKNTEANIQNILIVIGDFNIRDSV